MSPRAWSSAAAMAGCCPKFLEKLMTLTRESVRGVCLEPRQRTVATPIVDDHRFVVKSLECSAQTFEEWIDGGLVVVDRHENRQMRRRR